MSDAGRPYDDYEALEARTPQGGWNIYFDDAKLRNEWGGSAAEALERYLGARFPNGISPELRRRYRAERAIGGRE